MGKALTLDDFHFLTRIGKGQFGKVDAVRLIQNGQVYALKTIEKTKVARAGQSLDIDLEKDILVRASVARENGYTEWMPTPRLLATFASPNCVHFAVSFADCGTLWDLFCSSTDNKSRLESERKWTQQEETETLFGSASQVESAGLNSLFHSTNGSSTLSAGAHRLSEGIFLFYARQLVLALQWLHEEAAIAHRDVKPENVLLTSDGRAVICDFGSAARLSSHRDGTENSDDLEEARFPNAKQNPAASSEDLWTEPRYVPLSACQTLHGTADYIAPEVLQTYEQFLVDSDSFMEDRSGSTANEISKKAYDASVDWWSFGAMCYEMIAGLPPFYAKTVQETYGMIVSCKPVQIPHDSGFSEKMTDFLTLLLLPAEERLGRLGPEQVKRHALFTNTDWDAVRNNERSCRPSGFENPNPLRLSSTNSTDMPSIYQDDSLPIHFSTLHMSPSGAMPTWADDYGTHTRPAGSSLDPCSDDQESSTAKPWLGLQALQLPAFRSDDHQWDNWNWVAQDIVSPPPEASVKEVDGGVKPVPAEAYPRLPIRDRLKRESTPDRVQPSQTLRQTHGKGFPDHIESPIALSSRFKTPARGFPGVSDAVQLEPMPLSAPRTMPRTITRGTGEKMIIMSGKRAFKLMVKCVEASAKKKISASGRKTANAKNVTAGPDALHPAYMPNNIGGTASGHRKRSFLAKLQALDIGDSYLNQDLSSIDDPVHTAAWTGQCPQESIHQNASNALEHPQSRASAQVPPSGLVAGGFEAFVADLRGSAPSSGFQSSPRPSYGTAMISYSSDTSDTSSITDDERSDVVLPAIISSDVQTVATTTHGEAPVRLLSSSKQTSVVPKRMERDELLARLFPTFSANNSAQTGHLEISDMPHSINKREEHCADSRDVDKANIVDKSPMTATLSLVGKRYEKARTESVTESSPTVVIKGLVGQHEQMKRSLARLERKTQQMKLQMKQRSEVDREISGVQAVTSAARKSAM